MLERELTIMNFIIQYPRTTLFYFIVLLVIVTMARSAEKSKRNYNLIVNLIIILLSTVSGFRAFTVGIDTAGYVRSTFQPLIYEQYGAVYGEVGLKIVSRVLLMLFNNNISITLLCIYIMIHLLIIRRIWDYKNVISFPFAIFFYYTTFFALSLNIIAQFISVALLFYGTRYLERDNLIKFLVFLSLSILFHTSSIIGVLFIMIKYLKIKGISKKTKRIYLGAILLMPLIGIGLYNYIINYSRFTRYFSSYLSSTSIEFGMIVPIKILFILFVFFMYRKKKPELNNTILNNSYYYQIYKYCLVGTLLLFFGYFYRFTERLALPFIMFEPIFASLNYRSIEARIITRIGFGSIALLNFYIELSGNGNGIVPYLTFWM